MTSIAAFFKLIRLPNLLIIALVQYLIRYCLLIPVLSDFFKPMVLHFLKASSGSSFDLLREDNIALVLENRVMDFLMSDLHFFLLSLSTVMIAAAGYIINDYFDVRTDVINKPDKILIGTHIKRRVAMGAHLVISFIAIIIGFYLGWKAGNWQLGSIHAFAFIFLWFYSTNHKKQFLIGNILISLLSALVILVVIIFERQVYTSLIAEQGAYGIVRYIIIYLLAYALFAFVITFVREIVKDIEDIEGDKDINSKTMPIVIGVNKSKMVAGVIMLTFIVLLGYVQVTQFEAFSLIRILYILFALQLPSLFFLILLIKAQKKKEFHLLSRLVKGIMLMGVLSLLVFCYFN